MSCLPPLDVASPRLLYLHTVRQQHWRSQLTRGHRARTQGRLTEARSELMWTLLQLVLLVKSWAMLIACCGCPPSSCLCLRLYTWHLLYTIKLHCITVMCTCCKEVLASPIALVTICGRRWSPMKPCARRKEAMKGWCMIIGIITCYGVLAPGGYLRSNRGTRHL